MSALRSLLGLAALTAAAFATLGQLDARTSESRQAVIDRDAAQAVLALLPPVLRAQSVRLDRIARTGNEQSGWRVSNDNGAAIALVTTAMARGYGGDIRVQAATDLQYRVLGFRVLSHLETPAFVGDLLSQTHVDQIAGASVSSRAIAAAVETARTQARTLTAAEQAP